MAAAVLGLRLHEEIEVNWEAIGSMAEILGAGAVFASLVYLAIQIRGNTNQASAQMF